ncbi:MAG: putative lipid II flippase FtsW [Gammaproteobacteria bacterium]|nr:putative lipid II flippase FtsW [Gammaproteobacteria bacterium]NBT43782.1 putative lipid II flippase FtsW [Gammaproteobacteria bacterium]NBY22532.1 putative lipid II flippase FtsW [Gammaproteobacteria bacterium]NDG87915.1 putative lipid II flippase FtsW [Gammaproteobacteria bacterium]
MNAPLSAQNKGLVLQWRGHRFYLDPVLLITSLALLLFGYVMVTSASLHLGDKLAGDSYYFPRHQLIHIALGLMAGVMAGSVKLETWRDISLQLFFAGLVLLVVVLIPGIGKVVNGSSRWINLLGLRIQVSEVFKLIAVVYMASFIDRHISVVRTSYQGMLRPFLLLGVAAFLLLKEPDFGATAVILSVALGMLFLAGASLWQFGALIAVFVGAGVALIMTAQYRLRRVLSFIDPWDDPLNSDFQLTQALIAFGRGEWSGVGLGSSIQKMFYLPEAHTDFLFSVIGEELGLVGTTSVILLFMVLVWRAFVIGQLAETSGTRFSAFLAYGIGVWFGLQAFINMGVNMGMLPTKGLTLPLMSYGGGSIMVMCAALALLFRVRSDAIAAVSAKPRVRSTWSNV